VNAREGSVAGGHHGPVELRAARAADLEPLVTLAAAFFREGGFTTPEAALRRNLATLLDATAARVAVVADGPALLALAITTTGFGLEDGLIAELEDLYVVPPARRRGLAGRLIEDSARWARALGCRHLELVIAPGGHHAARLVAYYRGRGFRDDGRRLLSRPL
jgi:aminoglycoside 6'-N-acetyltransferase I